MEHREQIIGGVARRAQAKPGVETRKHIHRETRSWIRANGAKERLS
jgi:hypothetical protein